MLAKREKNNTVCDSEKKHYKINQIEHQHLKKYMKHKYHLWS